MKVKKNSTGRRFAISDIHGCLNTFEALLKKIQIQKEDELFLLGDYIDRGKDSKGVIDLIWAMQEEGFQVHCLRGNHEQMMLDAKIHNDKAPMWLMNGGAETVESFPNDFVQDDYFNWIMGLPYYFELDDYLLVHAGFNFRDRTPFHDITAMLWIRNWYEDLNRHWLGERVIIHGHTPTKRPILKERLKNISEVPIVNVDCGCYFSKEGLGFLAAFDLDEQAYIFQRNVEE